MAIKTTLFNGFTINTDGELIEIRRDGELICSYHPRFGETYVGVHSPKTWVNAKEALAHGKNQIEHVR